MLVAQLASSREHASTSYTYPVTTRLPLPCVGLTRAHQKAQAREHKFSNT